MKIAGRTIAVAVCLSVSSAVSLGAMLNVGTVVLRENEANQMVQFFVSGAGQQTPGMNFSIQVADGGPEVADLDLGTDEFPGLIDGPAITALDILTGTIFGANNTGQRDGGLPVGTLPQLAVANTTTTSGFIEPDGLLASVTFDTTGFFIADEPWDLIISRTLSGETIFPFGDELEISDGKIVLPEPTTCLLLLPGSAWLLTRRRRQR